MRIERRTTSTDSRIAAFVGKVLDRGGAGDVLGVAEDLALSLKGRCLNLLVLVVYLLACSVAYSI